MSVLNLGVPDYFRGHRRNANSEGIDESVWIENQDKYCSVNYRTNLYLLEDTLKGDIFKVGISSNVYLRCKQLNLNAKCLHIFKVKDEIYTGDSKLAFTMEQALLFKLKEYKLYRTTPFGGSSEVLRIEKEKILKVFANLRKLV